MAELIGVVSCATKAISSLNIFKEKDGLRFIETGTDYNKLDLWIMDREKGKKKELVMRGTLVRFIETGTDYNKLSLFFGLMGREKGKKKEFVMRGTKEEIVRLANALESLVRRGTEEEIICLASVLESLMQRGTEEDIGSIEEALESNGLVIDKYLIDSN